MPTFPPLRLYIAEQQIAPLSCCAWLLVGEARAERAWDYNTVGTRCCKQKLGY